MNIKKSAILSGVKHPFSRQWSSKRHGKCKVSKHTPNPSVRYVEVKEQELKEATRALQVLLLYLNTGLNVVYEKEASNPIIRVYDSSQNLVNTLSHQQIKSLLESGFLYSENV